MSFEPKFNKFPVQKTSILIVEDDEVLAMHMADNLSKAGYEVFEPVSTAKNVVDIIKSDPPTLILMDIELGKERNEIEAIEEISSISDIPIIFIAGSLEETLQNEVKIAASYGYLVKPVLERELTETIERALYKHKIDQQMKESETRYRLLFEEMVEAFALHEIVLDEYGTPTYYIFLDVNPAFELLTGLKKEDIINKRVLE